MNLDDFPRLRLGHWPTPLEHLPRLGRELGTERLYIKRDDCTGLATGGSKTRKLEFLVGDALREGADTLLTHGAVQSNHVRQTGAAAARAGLRCEALLAAGFRSVASLNPYWDRQGRTFEDHDGYRVVVQCAAWTSRAEPAPA